MVIDDVLKFSTKQLYQIKIWQKIRIPKKSTFVVSTNPLIILYFVLNFNAIKYFCHFSIYFYVFIFIVISAVIVIMIICILYAHENFM